jgi:COMPASS component SWD3
VRSQKFPINREVIQLYSTLQTQTLLILLSRSGLPGVKRRFASDAIEQRIAALKDALQYGQDGLDLIIQGLKDSSEQVQLAAYQLLRERDSDLAVKKALRDYNPYPFFECLHTIEARSSSSNHSDSVAISPDIKIVASGIGNVIKLWDRNTGELLRTLGKHSKQINCIAICPDGKILVSGSDDRTVKLWNLYTGQLLLTLTGHSYSVTSVAISPDGKTIASGSWNTINLWNLHTGKLLHTLEVDSGWVDFVAFTPDGEKIVTRSQQCIKVWGEQV